MRTQRVYLLLWCVTVGIISFMVLDFWQKRNAPLYRKLEIQWAQDVEDLESSKKLPPPWFDVREIELYGGTPETKNWLKRIEIPVTAKKPNGNHKLEVLVVAWEEDGKRGALIQYNLVDLKSGNMIWELGRTLMFRKQNLLEGLWQ